MRGKRSPACDDKGCVARDEPRLLGHQCCLHSVNSCLPWRELISQPPLSDICRMTRVFRSAGSGLPDDGELEEGRAIENDGLPQDALEGFLTFIQEGN
jgi:hypothetical protein